MESASRKPAAILVHGAWADGSSWQRVISILLGKGITTIAVQNPTTSLAADVAATRQAIDSVDGPVVLVGHSWGGAGITEAGTDSKVEALVYVAAFAPRAGESVGALIAAYPAPPGLAQIRDDGKGFLRLTAEGWAKDVGQDLPEAEARLLFAMQPPLAAGTFSDQITHAAWETRPSWYIVSTEDRIASIELQRKFAAMMGATTTELAASHLSLLSQPQAVADVILEALNAVASR